MQLLSLSKSQLHRAFDVSDHIMIENTWTPWVTLPQSIPETMRRVRTSQSRHVLLSCVCDHQSPVPSLVMAVLSADITEDV